MHSENALFWNTHELKQIHVELTNACNAACPLCARFHNNSPNLRPDLEIGQITLSKFKKYFTPEIIRQCRHILFCGVQGDPGAARDTLEICEYIASTSNNVTVTMNTNGGMRKSSWWAELGKIFANSKTIDNRNWQVTFSIDGLEDTNHIYRRNVNWKILMENVQAFINAGGQANWDYLIFKHNEHQLETARKMSQDLKFNSFTPKKAVGVDNGVSLVNLPAIDKDGNLEYFIEAPVNPDNRNLAEPQGPIQNHAPTFDITHYRSLKGNKSISNNFKYELENLDSRLSVEDNSKYDNVNIKCKSKMSDGSKEIFVDYDGQVMPCCYVGSPLNGIFLDSNILQLHKHVNDYGKKYFNLNNYSLEEILTGGHLDKVFANSWTKPTMAKGKLGYCSEICGTFSNIDRIFTHKDNTQ